MFARVLYIGHQRLLRRLWGPRGGRAALLCLVAAHGQLISMGCISMLLFNVVVTMLLLRCTVLLIWVVCLLF